MAISTLTGTSWKFNDNFYESGVIDDTFNINFKCVEETFSSIRFTLVPNGFEMYYGNILVYSYSTLTSTGTWTSNNYKMIAQISGADVTNQFLISILSDNATLLTEKAIFMFNLNLLSDTIAEFAADPGQKTITEMIATLQGLRQII